MVPRTVLTSIVLPIVLGAGSAVLATKLMSPESPPQGANAPLAPKIVFTTNGVPAGGGSPQGFLGAQAHSSPSADGAGAETHGAESQEAPGLPLPDPERALEEFLEWQDDVERAFAAETIDPAWAQKAEADFDMGLEAAGERGEFTVRSIECRRSRCRAHLELGEGGDAAIAAARQAILGHPFEENCSTTTYAVPPETGGRLDELFVHWECGGD